MSNRVISKTQYETPPDYEQVVSQSIPGEENRYSSNSNYYYPDNSNHHDVFNATDYNDSIRYYHSHNDSKINSKTNKINELNYNETILPLEPLQYDPYNLDYYYVARCITCTKAFTRYEKKKGTSQYVNCNNCSSHYKDNDNSSCFKCFRQCAIM